MKKGMKESHQYSVSKAKSLLAVGDKAADQRVKGKAVEEKADSLAKIFSTQDKGEI